VARSSRLIQGETHHHGAGKRKRFQKRKSCKFCEDKVVAIDYKDVKLIKLYVSERGKIIPRRITGTCAKHQRSLTTSIKRARNIALIPFAAGQ
jgi:small subunit ribosomal protein S18